MSTLINMPRALIVIASLLAIPLVIILALVALMATFVFMAFEFVAGFFRNKPRWDDAFSTHSYEAEAVRVDNNKRHKRPIIIEHE
ncbi:MAG: hypothetical protein AAFY99_07295 [Pseudomonadota bacterium]